MHDHRWVIVPELNYFRIALCKQPKVIRLSVLAVLREIQINKQLVITYQNFHSIKIIELRNTNLDMALSLIRAFPLEGGC